MEETKEDEAEDSAVAPDGIGGGRRKKSSWPHSVINAKAAKVVEVEKSTTAPKSKTERKAQLGPKSKMLKQNVPHPSSPGKTVEEDQSQPDKPDKLDKLDKLDKPEKVAAISDQGGVELADWKEGCTFKCKSCAFTATLR